MPRAVLALGAALLTASGCVWYVPALADLRAGADRPPSRRTAAAACLSGWSTIGIIAVLLLVARAWWIPCAVAVAGAFVNSAKKQEAMDSRPETAPRSGTATSREGRNPRPSGRGARQHGDANAA